MMSLAKSAGHWLPVSWILIGLCAVTLALSIPATAWADDAPGDEVGDDGAGPGLPPPDDPDDADEPEFAPDPFAPKPPRDDDGAVDEETESAIAEDEDADSPADPFPDAADNEAAPGLPGPAGEPGDDQPREPIVIHVPVQDGAQDDSGDGAFGDGPPITEIVFEGVEHIDHQSLLALLAIKEGSTYSPARVEGELAKLLDLGYFRRSREESYVLSEDAEDGNSVRVIFHLTENPPVNAFVFEGNSVLSDDDLANAVAHIVTPGDPYGDELADAIGEAVSSAYWEAGFVTIVLRPALSPEGTLTVPIIEQFIEEIRVEGLKDTKLKLVMNEIRTQPGYLYNVGQIRQDLDRLTDLGFFDSVSVADPLPGTQTGALILIYELEEGKTGVFDVGLGYGPKDGLTGYVALGERNLGGSGRQIGVRAEFGGISNYEFHFADPYLDSHHTSIELRVYSRRARTDRGGLAGGGAGAQAFAAETHTGGMVALMRPLDSDRKRAVKVGYVNEYVRNTDPRLINLVDLAVLQGRVGKLSLGFVGDSRDDRTVPARGGQETLEVQQAAHFLGSNYTFTKVDVDLRRYYPLGDRGTVALRGAYGHVGGEAPVFESFTAGGHDTIRGYREDRFVGSNMVLLNAEYRYRLFGRDPRRSLQAVLFADYGDAFGGQWAGQGGALVYPEHQTFNGAFGAGVGLRWYTRLGPIGVDYGVGSEGGRAYFTFQQTF